MEVSYLILLCKVPDKKELLQCVKESKFDHLVARCIFSIVSVDEEVLVISLEFLTDAEIIV